MTSEEAVASAAPPFAWMRILTVSMGWTTKSPTMPATWPATACAHVGALSLALELDGIAQTRNICSFSNDRDEYAREDAR